MVVMSCRIALYHNAEKIPQTEHFVVQEYLERPFLIDGFKCDLRIYVLVSSCDPLKVFLFNDGLVRMGTEQYKDPSPQNLVGIAFATHSPLSQCPLLASIAKDSNTVGRHKIVKG